MTPPRGAGDGTVGRTPGTVLVVAALLGGGIGWVALSTLDAFALPAPQVPVLTAVVVAVAAVAVGLLARWTRRTVHVQRRRIEPNRAVTLLLVGKAALIGGVGLAAGYAAVAGWFLPHLEAPLPRERVLGAGLVALASAGLAVAGRFLERACEIPGPPEDQADTT
jgi:hypothetical protein